MWYVIYIIIYCTKYVFWILLKYVWKLFWAFLIFLNIRSMCLCGSSSGSTRLIWWRGRAAIGGKVRYCSFSPYSHSSFFCLHLILPFFVSFPLLSFFHTYFLILSLFSFFLFVSFALSSFFVHSYFLILSLFFHLYILILLWTWGFTRYHLIYTIPIHKIEQNAITWSVLGAFYWRFLRSYIAKTAIFSIWVFWVICMYSVCNRYT